MASVIEALRYMIGASWEGESTVKKASGDIRNLGDETATTEQKSKASWKSIGASVLAAGAVFGGAALAAREMYQAIGEGAELVKAEDQFGRLADSINSTADAMMGRLRTATGGLVSDAELVNSASQIMSLGLQDTEDGVVRLAAVSGKLGWDMGTVILTMANNSKMRLDALGLSIEDVDAKTEKFIASGMSMDQAFDMAVIEAGEEKVALLGDSANTTAGQLAIFETGVKNAQDEFKVQLVREMADGIAEMGGNAQDAAKDMEYLSGKTGAFFGKVFGAAISGSAEAIRNQEAYARALDLGFINRRGEGLDRSGESTGIVKSTEELEAAIYGYDRMMASTRGTNNKFIQDQNNIAVAFESSNEAMIRARNEANDIITSYKLVGIETANLRQETESAAWNTEHFGGTLALTDEKLLAVYGTLGLDEDAMGRLGAAVDNVVSSMDKLNAELDEMNGKTVDVYVNSTIEQRLRGDANADSIENYYRGGGTGGDDRPLPSAPTGGIPGVPSTGGPVSPKVPNVTINNYNERTAALTMTMLQQQRRNGGSAV